MANGDIERLKAEWDSLQPLSPEYHDRLWKKLRFEWNYQFVPGRSKEQPNNVVTATGQIFRFADPIDAPARMQRKKSLHLLKKAQPQ